MLLLSAVLFTNTTSEAQTLDGLIPSSGGLGGGRLIDSLDVGGFTQQVACFLSNEEHITQQEVLSWRCKEDFGGSVSGQSGLYVSGNNMTNTTSSSNKKNFTVLELSEDISAKNGGGPPSVSRRQHIDNPIGAFRLHASGEHLLSMKWDLRKCHLGMKAPSHPLERPGQTLRVRIWSQD